VIALAVGKHFVLGCAVYFVSGERGNFPKFF